MAPKVKFWGSSFVRSLDSLGTKIDIAAMADDVLSAPTKEEAEKRAFVDTAGIAGGRLGTTLGGAIAFGEEGAAPVVSTPIAIATVAGMNFAGTYLAQKTATLLWDAGELAAEEEREWKWKR